MDTASAVKKVGWVSVWSGVAMTIAPGGMARLYGLPARGLFARVLGLRDIAIGAGLLAGSDAKAWMTARAASDTVDTALIGVQVLKGPVRPVSRMLAGAGAAWWSWNLVRKLT